MKVTITRAALMKPVQLISGVVEKRQTLPILSNVLLAVHNNVLSLTGTDLEIELIGKVSLVDPSTDGSITVAARTLMDICRALPDDAQITLSLEDSHLIIRSGRSRFVLKTLPASDFPNIETAPFDKKFSLTQSKLKKLIAKIHFAMGQQDVRHYLNGTLIDINQGVMKCVATDGHRLAYCSTDDIEVGDIQTRIIVPRKSVLELTRLLDTNNAEDMSIHIGDSHFRLETADFTFTSKLINAQYPDYERLIPKSSENTVIAPRETLKQALGRASILCNEKFRGIRLHLEKNLLRIVANNPEQEEAEEIVTVEYDGAPLEIGFNVAYLLDAISGIASEQLKWSFNDSDSSSILEPHDFKDFLYCLYVVMPLRL